MWLFYVAGSYYYDYLGGRVLGGEVSRILWSFCLPWGIIVRGGVVSVASVGPHEQTVA